MIWKHKSFLKTEALILFCFLLCSGSHLGNAANLAEAPPEKLEIKPAAKAELPLDAFQTRTLPLAKKYLFEGDFDKSKNLLETLLELDPRNVEAHLILGEICIKQKNFERASQLLKEVMQLSSSPDLALKANAWLKIVPNRYTKPKARAASKRGLENVQTVEDERELSMQQDKSLKLLVFTASWLPEAISFADQVKETAQTSGSPTEVKTVALESAKNAKLFEEYSISLLPAVVVLKSDGHFVGGLAGAQVSHDLKSLLRATK